MSSRPPTLATHASGMSDDHAGIRSPCISVCRMHAASGWCVGCLRSLDEIAAWGSMPDAERRVVLEHLSQRRDAWHQRWPEVPVGAAAAESPTPTHGRQR